MYSLSQCSTSFDTSTEGRVARYYVIIIPEVKIKLTRFVVDHFNLFPLARSTGRRLLLCRH